MVMRLVDEYADAMRVGAVGVCIPTQHIECFDENAAKPQTLPILPYHVLEGDAVRHLRTASAGGGIAFCDRCGVAIFVPGNPDAGVEIPVRRGDHWGSTLVTDRKPRFDVETL